MATRVRPLTVDDLEDLVALDAAYSERHDLEPLMSLASANFHARSGHSFVLEDDTGPQGFVLAHAVWNGVRPIVRATRLVVAENTSAERATLIETLTKSAYDAAVYDLEIEVPDADDDLRAALESEQYRPAPSELYRRGLGSRGQGSP